jgi:predicted ATPase with chaperone activity
MELQDEVIFTEPLKLEETGLNEEFVRNLLLKVVGKFGPTVKEISNMTGLSQSVIEPLLMRLEDEKFISFEGTSGMTAYLRTTILTKGREYLTEIIRFDSYVGIAPVAYKHYKEAMSKLTQGRYPLTIRKEMLDEVLDRLYVSQEAKRTLELAMSVGRGIIVYGPAGNGKTTISSRLSRLLPPIIMPRCIEYGGNVINLFDPDFHVSLPENEQPKDRRWVKVQAPFVFTGPELTTKNLDARYDPDRGLYVAQPQLKAHGGVFLVDDLGRQTESHHIILNRLIYPMENKKDIIYIAGVPIEVFTDFIPILSTNISIAIFDEAHLRRAPFHVYLGPPEGEKSAQITVELLLEKGIETPKETLDTLKNIFKPKKDGGLGLTPSFAVLDSLVQLIEMICTSSGSKVLDDKTLSESIDNNIVLALQKQDVVLRQLDDKFKREISSFEFKVEGSVGDVEKAAMAIKGIKSFTLLEGSLLADLTEGISPVVVAKMLESSGINVKETRPLGKTQIPMVDEELLGRKRNI